MNKPTTLLYLAGSSYSGSTLMDLLLGSHPAVESLGEAKKIRSVQKSMDAGAEAKCNCGAPVAECAFWRTVLEPRREFEEGDPAANADLFNRALAFRGRSVILDNSKNVGRALMLHRSRMFDMHVLHVVRDSRAVVFSHRRKSERRTKDNSFRLFPTARQWNRLNLRIARSFRGKNGVSYLLVRYEDLVADPEKEIRRILGQLSLPWNPQVLHFRESCHHGIEGNRMRLGNSQKIERDDEYISALSWTQWWTITALTLRGLCSFGYKLGRPRRTNSS